MARLETIIDGSVDGLETAATRAIGILEGLQKVADKLKIDLFQATTVEDLNSVGVALTAVTGKYNDYVNAALRGNSVWQDQQATKALDALDAKLRVVNGNAELFGRTMAVDRQEVRAYQSALDSLLKAGLDPTDSRVQSLVGNINRLNAAINAASSGQKNPFTQFENASGIIGNLENRLKNLRQALREATDTRQIVSLNRRIRETGDELARVRGLGDQATGMLGRLEAESKRLRTALTFAKSEKELEKLGAEIRQVEGEIARLNNVAGVMNRRFGSDGRQAFNQFGLEFGRVIQDLPYAANNFGSVGNNITRMVEVFPGYIAMLQATVIEERKLGKSTTLMQAAFKSFFTGANAWLLGISAVVTAITFYTQWQQKAARETKEATKANRDYAEGLKAVSKAIYEGAQRSQQDVSKLNTLIKVTRDASASVEARKGALKELQELYPRVFKNFDLETIKTDKATSAYKELTGAIIANANARAAEGLIAEKASNQLALDEQNKALSKQISLVATRIKQQEELSELPGRAVGGSAEAIESGNVRRLTDLYRQRDDLETKFTSNLLERAKLQEEINDLSDFAFKNQLKFDARLIDTAKQKESSLSKQLSYTERIAAISEKSAAKESRANMTGWDLDVSKIMSEYQGLYIDLDQLQKRIDADTKLSSKEKSDYLIELSRVRAQLGIDEAARLSAAEIKWAKETKDTIAGILDEAGVNRTNSLQGELSKIDAHYAELRRKYEGHQEILDAINEAHEARRAQATANWAAKLTDIRIEYTRKLNETQSQTLKRQLDDEFRARVAMAKKTLHTEEERLKAQEELQQEYWRKLEAIQQFERMERLANDFGDAFGRAFETSLSTGENVFKQIYQEFRKLIIRMIAQQAALKAANIFGNLFGVGNAGDSARGGSQSSLGDLLNGISKIFTNNGSAGKWTQGVAGVFKGSGQGGQFIDRFGKIFSSNQGGGGFLNSLVSILSSSGSGGGGLLGKLFGFVGGLFGGSKYRSGNFPTGNFGGGNFPQYDNPQRIPSFVPQGLSGNRTENINLNAKIGHDAIYLSNKIGSQRNDRFYGGK